MSRKSEKNLKAMMKYLEENSDETTTDEEIENLLQSYVKQQNAMWSAAAESEQPLCADDYLELAEESKTKKKRLEYLNKALELEPDNLDASLMLVNENSKSELERLNALEKLIEAGDRQMTEEGYFRDSTGNFWLVLETRPYMRVRAEYFDALIDCGMMRAAAKEGERLIELCEDDNLGIRFRLIHLYAALEEEKAAKKLLEKYSEHDETMLMLSMAALYFKLNKLDIAEDYLRRLTLINKDTKKFFSGLIKGDAEKFADALSPYGYRPYTLEELIVAFMENHYLYRLLPEFFIWANDRIKKMQGKKTTTKKSK